MISIPLVTVARKAGGAIPAARLVARSAANTVVVATDPTKPIVGIADYEFDVASGAAVDVHKGGARPVIYGGPVQEGDPLTTDASGRAIKSAPGSGVVHYLIGFAAEDGVLGDMGSVLISPATLRG